MNNESNKIRINIPKIDERFDLWAQMQGVAHWIFEITDDWWNSDEELRKYASPCDETYDDIYDEQYDPDDDIPF